MSYPGCSSCQSAPPYPQPPYPQPPYPQPPYPRPPSQSSCSPCSTCPPGPRYPPILVGTGPTGPAGDIGPVGPRSAPFYICGTIAPVTIAPGMGGLGATVIIATSVFLLPSTWDQVRVNGSFSFRFSTPTFTTGGFYMNVNSVAGDTFKPPYYYINSFINQPGQQIASGTIVDTFDTTSLTEGTYCMINLFFSDLAANGLTITGGTFCFQIEPITPMDSAY
jgi:hypothetical protein